MTFTRRRLLALTVPALTLTALTVFPAFPEQAAAQEPAPTSASSARTPAGTYDVVVVGSGGAGLSAALSAAEEGASVLLIEKTAVLGGNTLRASGLFNAADPERQRPMGIVDSVDWHYEQTMASGAGRNAPTLVRRFVEEALPTLHWLETLGIRFLPETVATWGAEWPRGHKPLLPRGTAYIRMLSGALLAKGGQIRTRWALKELLLNPDAGTREGAAAALAGIAADAAVAGIVVQTPEGERVIRARRGVVLASGGFAASPERLARWAPDFAAMPTDNAPGNTGEVLDIAKAAGAALANLDAVQAVPGAPAGRTFQVRLDLDAGRSMLVDGRGAALVDEDLSRVRLAAAIRSAEGGAFVITDDAAVESYDPVSRKAIYRGLETGDAVRADSVEALARDLGLDPATLARTVEAFNGEVQSRTGKCGRIVCRPIATPPFWGSKVVLNVHTTMGGVVITPEAEVLGANGRVIPGLYAAGDVVGNLHGANRIGGNGISAAVTMGRIAGRNAARRRP